MHVGDYLGAEKPRVVLTNYEANTGWFPVTYHDSLNPFATSPKARG